MPDDQPSIAAIALIDEVVTRLLDDLPTELAAPSVRARVALWVATRSLTRLRTIQQLIRIRQVDDALILMRPLLSDSERMQFVAGQPESDRDALVVSWVDHALNEWSDIADAADRSNEAGFGEAIREMVSAERRGLDTARPGKRIPLPTEGLNLMRRIGRTDDEVDYVLASKSSHGAITSTIRHLEVGPEGIAFNIYDPDPEYPRGIARRACRHMVRLMAAAAIVGEFPRLSALAGYADELEARLDAEEGSADISRTSAC